MIQKPPHWQELSFPELFSKIGNSDKTLAIIEKAQKRYVYWEKFRRYSFPDDITAKEAWSFLKIKRLASSEKTPIKSLTNSFHKFGITKLMYQHLHTIDSNTSGFLHTEAGHISGAQKQKLITEGITEEAIASSQMEGANTSRKVAKKMLLSKRAAKTRSEQMIVNNYQIMEKLIEWKDGDLSYKMLLEMQKIITGGTLDDNNDAGRFRDDTDDIRVMNSITQEIVFTPPKKEFFMEELKKLIAYANEEEDEDNFVHPIIKACLLHFWLAYLHPFIDGNGRTARALFYWYVLKRGYWMFQYLSVSKIIKKTKRQYENSFLYTENDDDDVTYFLMYHLRVIINSIVDFREEYQKKINETKVSQKILKKIEGCNDRQILLLKYLYENKEDQIDITIHQSKHGIVYQTARSDLLGLVKRGLLMQMKRGKKYIFIPNKKSINTLFAD